MHLEFHFKIVHVIIFQIDMNFWHYSFHNMMEYIIYIY